MLMRADRAFLLAGFGNSVEPFRRSGIIFTELPGGILELVQCVNGRVLRT